MVIAAALVVPATASANLGVAFTSPTGNVVCWSANGEFGDGFVGCTTRRTASPRCGQVVSAGWNFTRRGLAPRPVRSCRDDSGVVVQAGGARKLAYGRSARILGAYRGVIRCTSRRTAMVCTGPGGTIILSRERVRVVRR